MKKQRLAFLFIAISAAVLFANLILIAVFSFIDVTAHFYDALNVSSLAIAFVGLISSGFFSFAVYLQTERQNKINESLPQKDDQYIIANYSLFNIENEMSFFSLDGDEKENLLCTGNLLRTEQSNEDFEVTRLVFLPTESVNMPTYQVLVHQIDFFSSRNKLLYSAKATPPTDGDYSANILSRGYNCICVDVLQDMATISTTLSNCHHIELTLDIISVFNVKMTVTFYIHLDALKNVDDNPDKAKISDLATYIIHHSNYRIQEKSIFDPESTMS